MASLGNVGRVWVTGQLDWTRAKESTKKQLKEKLGGMAVAIPGTIDWENVKDDKEAIERALSPIVAKVKLDFDPKDAKRVKQQIENALYGIKAEVDAVLDDKSVRKANADLKEKVGTVDAAVLAEANKASARFASTELARQVHDATQHVHAEADLESAKRAGEAIDKAAGSKNVKLIADADMASVESAQKKISAAARNMKVRLVPDIDTAAFVAAKATIKRLVSPVKVRLEPETAQAQTAFASALQKFTGGADKGVPFTFRPVFQEGSLAGLKSMWQKHVPGNPMWVWPKVNWSNLRTMKNDLSAKMKTLGADASRGLKAGFILDDILPKNGFHNDFLRSLNELRGAAGKNKVTFKELGQSVTNLGTKLKSNSSLVARAFRIDAPRAFNATLQTGRVYASRAASSVKGFGQSVKETFSSTENLKRSMAGFGEKAQAGFRSATAASKGFYKAYQQSGLQKLTRWKIQVKTEEAIKQVTKFAGHAKKTLMGAFAFGGASMMATSVLKTVGSIGSALKQMAPALNAVAGGMAAFAAGAGVALIALQDAKTQLADLEEPLNTVKQGISDTFWGEARVPILENAQKLIGELTPSLNQLSATMGGVFAKFADAAGRSSEQIKTILASSDAGFGPFGDAVAKATEALLNMLAAGSTFFPQFTQWLSNITGKWLEWTQKTDLVAWTQKGLDAVKAFWKVLSNLVGILADFMSMAAASASSMSEFGDRLADIRQAINEPAIRGGFEKFFASVAEGSSQVVAALGRMLVRIGEFGPQFGAIVKNVGTTFAMLADAVTNTIGNQKSLTGINNLVKGFNSLIEVASPAVEVIGTRLFDSLGRVGNTATKVAPNLEKVAASFANVAGMSFETIATVAERTFPAISGAAAKLAPVLEALAKAVLPVLGDWISKILSVGAEILANFVTPIAAKLTELMPRLHELGDRILSPILDILKKLSEPLGNLVAALLPVAMTILEGLVGVVGRILTAINDTSGPLGWLIDKLAVLVGWLTPVFQWAGKVAGGILALVLPFSGVTSALVSHIPWLTKLIKHFSTVFSWVGQVGGKLGWLKGVFAGVPLPIKLAIAAVVAFIAIFKNWDTIKEKVTEVWGHVKEYAGKLGNILHDVWFGTGIQGGGLGGGMAAGLTVDRGLKGKLEDFFKGLPEQISGWMSKISDWFKEWFPVMLQKLGDWLGKVIDKLVIWFAEIITRLPGWLANVLTWFAGWFPGFLAKLVVWLGKMLVKLAGFFVDIVTHLPGWTWAVVKWLAGWLVDRAKNLGTWLAERWPDFTAWFKQFVSNLPGWFRDVISGIKEKGKETISGLWDGIKAKWEDVKEWFGGLWQRIKNELPDALKVLLDKGKDVLGGFWDGVKKKWEDVKEWFQGLFQRIKDAIFHREKKADAVLASTGSDTMEGFHDNGVLEKWKTIKEWFEGLWERIKELLPDAVNVLVEKGKDLMSGFKGAVDEKWEGVKEKVGGWWTDVKSKLPNAPGVLVEKGKDLVSGFRSNMDEKWTGVKEKVGGWWNDIRGKLPNASGQLSDKGRDLVQGMNNGTSTPYSSMVRFFQAIPQSMKNALGNVSNILSGSGSSIISGLHSGMNSPFSNVLKFFNQMHSQMRRFAVGLDDKLLGNAGTNIVIGLYNGLVTNFNKYVIPTVSQWASTIAKYKGPLPYDRRVLEPNGAALVEGLRNGLADSFKDVLGDVSDWAERIADTVDDSLIEIPVSASLDNSAYSAAGALGPALLAGTPNTAVGNQYNVSMNLDGDDLRDLRSIADFTDMMKVRARMVAGSGF